MANLRFVFTYAGVVGPVALFFLGPLDLEAYAAGWERWSVAAQCCEHWPIRFSATEVRA